ncbi:UNVERIFIED_ORG: hypothetical protein LHK14_27170 (plasmid) [Roseateles sp. XES5]|nr:hypothetical protein [Roseateles sp. XES5]
MPGQNPPRTLAELKLQIVSRDIVLSAMLEQVARSAFEAPDIIAFETGNAFARRTGVPPQTVERLARRFGFKNFRDFRELFRTHLRELTERAP